MIEKTNYRKTCIRYKLTVTLQTTEGLSEEKYEIEQRWHYDIATLVWENSHMLIKCDLTDEYIENMVSVLPGEKRSIAREQIDLLQSECSSTPLPTKSQKIITLPANSYVRSLNVSTSPNYGNNLILNAPPYNARPNAATYEFTADGGSYDLWITYAAASLRPVRIIINGETVIQSGLSEITGGWYEENVKRILQGTVNLRDGFNLLTLSREGRVSSY